MFGLGLGVDFRISPIQSKLSHSSLSNDAFPASLIPIGGHVAHFCPIKFTGNVVGSFIEKAFS